MRISIEGCPPDSFNPTPAVNIFFETPGGRRPEIQPYGPKRASTTDKGIDVPDKRAHFL